MYTCHHVKYTLFFLNFKEHNFFFDRFLKNTHMPNLMKICSVGAEFFHAHRQRDITKLRVAFLNFTNVPNKTKKTSSVYDCTVEDVE